MEEIGFFTQVSNEISSLDLPNFIIIVLLFFVPFYFSKKAETLFFHLLYSFFGLYMIATMEDTRVIYDVKMLVGLGLLLPQLKFIQYFTIDTIQTIRMMTTNTYYFFITIYYKILRFIDWIKSTYIMLKTFFTTFSFKKEDYYEQGRSSQQDYSYEQKHRKFYEEPKQEEQSYTEQEEPKRKPKYEEFERFYSDSAYTILGVSADDDYETIKKAYRNILKDFHPDKNHDKSPEELKIYTEITQNINDAMEKVESWKK